MSFYTCDDIIPDLCQLEEEHGKVEIKGINVTFFKFTAAQDEEKLHSSRKFPIIAIHGGPSFTHNYMLPLKQQACRGRTIVFYDQAGCGQSRPVPGDFNATSDYPWLLDPMYYATVELPAIIQHLGFEDFHIVGNSWGTMLSLLYALNAKDDTRRHLTSMVLSGPFSDSQIYIQAQWDQQDGSLGGLPPFVQQRIHALEEDRAYNSDEYKALDSILTGFFTVRTQPPPDCWVDSEDRANMEIYTAMQGPSEFAMQGVLADLNLTGRLKEIEVPVLLSHGKFDTMRPSIVQTMKEALPNADTLFLEKSGHVSMIDEPGAMNDGMAYFYDRVEASSGNLLGLSRRQSLVEVVGPARSSQNVQASPSVPSSMLIISTLVALMAGYVMGQYRERQRYIRPQYTALSD